MIEYENMKYDDFCKEVKCVHYNLIERLSFMENNSEIERQLQIAKIYCRKNCEHTAQEFYRWMTKANN